MTSRRSRVEGYWTGTVSLFIEAALIVLSATTLWAARRPTPVSA